MHITIIVLCISDIGKKCICRVCWEHLRTDGWGLVDPVMWSEGSTLAVINTLHRLILLFYLYLYAWM